MKTNQEYKTLGELENKYYGVAGTPEREQYEFELSMETQEQLGLLIGVQKAQISKLEKGNNSASISTVIKVFSAMKAKIKFKIELANSPELIAQ